MPEATVTPVRRAVLEFIADSFGMVIEPSEGSSSASTAADDLPSEGEAGS